HSINNDQFFLFEYFLNIYIKYISLDKSAWIVLLDKGGGPRSGGGFEFFNQRLIFFNNKKILGNIKNQFGNRSLTRSYLYQCVTSQILI
ncbi:hypothetical protein KKG31_00050, partial [Patescibacteria group bacterium]|nr:hypothetical protein [Patescibacteria group bacterium]